jgi:hypothetical protein
MESVQNCANAKEGADCYHADDDEDHAIFLFRGRSVFHKLFGFLNRYTGQK